VNNAYRDRLTAAGVVFSGTSPDGRLVEFVELPPTTHPFYVGTQAHPELRSRPTRPHPLFRAFVRAAVEYAEADQLPAEFLAAARGTAAGADHDGPVADRPATGGKGGTGGAGVSAAPGSTLQRA
jgi:CTP synthase